MDRFIKLLESTQKELRKNEKQIDNPVLYLSLLSEIESMLEHVRCEDE